VVGFLPDPKPAYNTILTFLRILEKKEFISYQEEGRKHIYYPLVEKGEYTRWTLTEMKDKLFNGSARSMVNTFIMESGLSDSDVRELIDMLNMLETAKS
jgi:predicted transcriptional regulator